MKGCWICKGEESRCACCAYIANQTPENVPPIITLNYNSRSSLFGTTRLTKLFYLSTNLSQTSTVNDVPKRVLTPMDMFMERAPKKARVSRKTESVALKRLTRFLKVLDILNQLPGRDVWFEENQRILRILVATHLKIIAGKDEFKANQLELYKLIDDEDFSMINYLIWVTSRQQGKTTLYALFYAALLLTPYQTHKEYIMIYSVTKDRSKAMVEEIKEYLVWVQNEFKLGPKSKIRAMFVDIGLPHAPVFIKNNSETVQLSSMLDPDINVIMKARPGNPNSCRGDAGVINVGDEFLCFSKAFWQKFMLPLFSIDFRTLALATTPADPQSHIATFLKKTEANMKAGINNWYLVNHCLMCDECHKKNREICAHNLYLLPPWKSNMKIRTQMNSLSNEGLSTFRAEVLGRPYDAEKGYFPSELTRKLFVEAPYSNTIGLPERPVITIAVDPPSDQRSCMGLYASVLSVNGTTLIIGASEVEAARCESRQIEVMCEAFTTKIINLRLFRRVDRRHIKVLPVVECNNCAILSSSIVSTIAAAGGVLGCSACMPFSREFFKEGGIKPGIGILTTEQSKAAAVQYAYSEIANNRIRRYTHMSTIGPIYTENPKTPTKEEVMLILHNSLVQFKDDPKGKISGKTADTNDDLAMAFLIGIHNTNKIRMRESRNPNILQMPYRSLLDGPHVY